MTESQIRGLLGACETQRGKRIAVPARHVEYLCRRALTATRLQAQITDPGQPHIYGPGLIPEETP